MKYRSHARKQQTVLTKVTVKIFTEVPLGPCSTCSPYTLNNFEEEKKSKNHEPESNLAISFPRNLLRTSSKGMRRVTPSKCIRAWRYRRALGAIKSAIIKL